MQPKWGEGGVEVTCVRVLVVEDFAPFRRFVSLTLGNVRDFEVICETSDGLEAVQKAAELKPDLILMDIGLPSLNGIEAGRRIRTLVPECKIIFLSQESSADVMEEALCLGAWAYVVKSRAASDLLPALEAIVVDRQLADGIQAIP
jgi:DNA-binding NarL/FixJ family response regulator